MGGTEEGSMHGHVRVAQVLGTMAAIIGLAALGCDGSSTDAGSTSRALSQPDTIGVYNWGPDYA